MSKNQLNKRLGEINIQISKLEKERFEIQNQLMELSDNFIEKFKIWYNSNQGGEYPYIPPRDEYPLLRKLINNRDFDRYREYTIDDVIGEENLFVFLEYEEAISEYGDSDVDDIIIKYKPVIEEMMKGNIKSFTYDW